MNLLYLKMGPMRFRGGGGGGGGGGGDGDSGDSGDSGIGDGIGPSAGPGAGPGAPGTGPSSNGDVGEGNDSPGAVGVDSDVANMVADMAVNPSQSVSSNGIAGMMGIDNPSIASIVNGIVSNAVTGITGMPGIVGMANAAINGSPGQAAATMGSVIGGMVAGPVGAGLGGMAGNAIGNMPGVDSNSVPGDPTGGGSGVGESGGWTASPRGTGTLSGGLGLPSAPGASTLAGESTGSSPNVGSLTDINNKLTERLLNQTSVAGDPGDFSGAGYATPALVQALRKAVDKPEFAWN